MPHPKVTAIVLNWNNYSDTAECLSNLTEMSYPNFEILLLDNGSTDDSGERLAQEFPDVRTTYNAENLGFPGGVNVGIREAIDDGAEYVWLVNNDIIIEDQAILDGLVSRMENNEDIGVLTPVVREYPDTDSIWFDQGYIDWDWFDRGPKKDVDLDTSNDLIFNDYLPFCSSLIRSTLFNEIGYLREEYFLYGADIDYCVRVTDHGYEVATDTSKALYHRAFSSSGESTSPIPSYYEARNRFIFADMFRKKITPYKYYTSYMIWISLLLGYRILLLEFKSVKAIFEGVIDGISGKTGKGRYP